MRIGVSAVGVTKHGAGVDRYLFEILKRLVQSEHEFVVFGDSATIPEAIVRSQNVKIVEVDERWHFGIGRIVWHQSALLAQVAKQHLDLVWIPNNRLVLYCNAPVVMTVHDLAEFAIKGKYSPLRMFYRRYLMRLALARVQHVLTDSFSSANDLTTIMGLPKEKVTPIHLGWTLREPSTLPDRDATLSRFDITSPFVLSVGRLEHPAKNLILSMDVVAEVRRRTNLDVQYVIAGVDSWRAQTIRDHATQHGYSFVRFLGFVDDPELEVLYRSARSLLFLSRFEGFGLPPLEAMASGLPVVCSNVSSIPEVVGSAAIQVDPDDEEGACAALVSILTDAAFSQALSERGKQQSINFSWERAAQETLAVLEREARSPGKANA